MTPRPEIVELLVSFDPAASEPARGHLVHKDGRPFTAEEATLFGRAKADDMRAAEQRTIGEPDREERLLKILASYQEWVMREAEMGGPIIED